MSNTTTDVLASNIDPFSARNASHLNANGDKVYWAVTWYHSATPNGRYEITRMSSRHYSVTHYQMVGPNHQIVRYISFATTKAVAVRYAQLDSHELEDKITKAIFDGKALPA